MLTVLDIIKKTTGFLEGKEVENARLNAEHLVGHALGLARMQLYLQFERPLEEEDLEKIRPLVRRRGQREPLQYIMGTTEFFGVELKVDSRALIPRPETEYLAAQIVEKLPQVPHSILDLGTGSGALALSLAQHYIDAKVLATDVSADAVALAKENAAALNLADRVEVRESDWFAAIEDDATYDLIVSNPPYLSEQETEETLTEVKDFEPRIALTPGGSESGLEPYEIIIREAHNYLAPGGLLAMETGIAQREALEEMLTRSAYARHEFVADLTERERFVFTWKD